MFLCLYCMYEYACSCLAWSGLSHARSLNACTEQVLCSVASCIPAEQSRCQSTGRPPERWKWRTDVGQALEPCSRPQLPSRLPLTAYNISGSFPALFGRFSEVWQLARFSPGLFEACWQLASLTSTSDGLRPAIRNPDNDAHGTWLSEYEVRWQKFPRPASDVRLPPTQQR